MDNLNKRIWGLAFAWLQAFDTYITAKLLSESLIQEMNPIMAIAWNAHPLVFLTVKVLTAGIYIGLTWSCWERKWVRYSAYVLTAVFAALVGYEIWGVNNAL